MKFMILTQNSNISVVEGWIPFKNEATLFIGISWLILTRRNQRLTKVEIGEPRLECK